MDVARGHCWRCEKELPKQSVKCNGCPLAEYCCGRCQQQDRVRHGSVECRLFGPKQCTDCGTQGQVKECTGCNNAWYCNSTCQKRNWSAHKKQCKYIQKCVQERGPLTGEFHTDKGEQLYRTEEPPVYIGNTLATDFLQLKQNEWSGLAEVGAEELQRDFRVLSAGCGDLRNTVLTVASLPAEYQGKLHVSLDDIDPFVMARNVMFLVMMVRYADKEGISSSLATIWYSVHISSTDYELIRSTLQELVLVSSEGLHDLTQGMVRVSEADLGYLREVWEGWLAQQCQRKKDDSINLHQQRKHVFDRDYQFKIGIPQYLARIPARDAKYMREWFDYGLFLSKDMHHTRLTYDNPTLTGRPSLPEESNEIQQRRGLKTPKEYSFVYCVRTDQTPFMVWDCLRVDEFSTRGPSGSSVMVRYHAYVTHLLEQAMTFIRQNRLDIHVFLANCLDFPNHHLTLEMPNYDRIFTSNLSDYLGTGRLLKTFKPLLNCDNKHSTIVTQTMNWIVGPTPEADVQKLPLAKVMRYRNMCMEDTGFSEKLASGVNNHREYYDTTHWFLAYLRTDIMGGGIGIPVMDHAPKLAEVMHYNGMRMRDFRKELNRLVPFQYRVNARRITMQNGQERNVEWCL